MTRFARRSNSARRKRLALRACGFVAIGITVVAMALAGPVSSKAAPSQGAGQGSAAQKKSSEMTPRPAPQARGKSVALSSQTLDLLVDAELKRYGIEPGPLLSDEEFLRRVYLDVTGRMPPADRVAGFADDKNPRKRSKLIRELLATPEYARHWGRFWCDVITFRTRGEDDHIKPEMLADWFARQLAAGTPWNEVTRQLITATGRNDESGPANFILAQMARPEDLGAETARVFLGVQLLCSQCHDDPNGVWKRQQFHDFAAFFGRLDEERIETGADAKLPPGVKAPTPPFRILVLDQVRKEYMMPDKDDASRATPIVQPRALSGPAMSPGASDAVRRENLAVWVAGQNNDWFPRAFVNRVWSQLMGAGFTSSVDDMGPHRPVLAPTVLFRLAGAWRSSGYDVRWLMELILNSQSYQRKSPLEPSSEFTRFAGVPPLRLQAGQILDSLAVALEGPRFSDDFRARFTHDFEFDPSVPIDSVPPTIAQSLLMMNDPVVAGLVDRAAGTMLARLLESGDDNAATDALYLRMLSRHASDRECELARAHVVDVGNRREAFEDLLWCLINSTEFLTKR